MLQLRFSGLLLAASLALAACGGGGGNTGLSTKTPATVTDANARELADASMAGAKEAIHQETAGSAVPFMTRQALRHDPAEWLARYSLDLLRQQPAAQSPAPRMSADPILIGNCGGDVRISSGDEVSGTITFNNYCMEGDEPGDRIVIHGVMRVTTREAAGREITTITYDNIRMTYGGETHYLNSSTTISCSLTDTDDCIFENSSTFTGEDGNTYELTNVEITGDNSSGYSIEARIYHPEHGYVEFVASGITVCDNGNIGSGSIVVSDSSGEVMEITFNSCSSYTITRNGVAEPYGY